MHRATLLFAALVLALARPAFSAPPFDVSDPTPRMVQVFLDDDVNNPASIGTNYVLVSVAPWSSDPNTNVGTVTVPAVDVAAYFSSLIVDPNTSVDPNDIQPFVIDIDLSGYGVQASTSGTITLQGVPRLFDMHLNTYFAEFQPPSTYYGYSNACYRFITGIPGVILDFNQWRSDSGAPGTSTCVLTDTYVDPSISGYDPGTGQLNAVGPIRLFVTGFPDPLKIISPGGDLKLLEAECPGAIGNDADGDQWDDGCDNCVTITNSDQADADSDDRGDACDSCTYVANSSVTPLAFQTTTGGQLDDDADGFGNQCDADYNQAGAAVDSTDLGLFKFAFGKKRTQSTCNPGGTSACDRYDHNNAVATIDSTDFTIFKTLFAKTKKSDGDIMDKCAACPALLPCVGDACP
jgi:hypothetical protein